MHPKTMQTLPPIWKSRYVTETGVRGDLWEKEVFLKWSEK